jgi:ribonuclease R
MNKSIDLHKIARSAIERYGFDFALEKPVIDEIGGLKPPVPADGAQAGSRDLRALLWSSIDNAESRDLDQVEYCEAGPDGVMRVKVAIADVDHCVPRQSRTDAYAGRNATSVYTGIDVFPLLPARLSLDLTSLLPGVDHYAVVIEFSVFSDGSIVSGAVYRAIICNKAKLVYDEIGDWLEGKTGVPASVARVPGLTEQIELQDQAAERLSRFRIEQGALEFGTIEAKAVVRDEDVVALVVQEKNRARSVIENFMVAANVTMSRFLKNAGVPMIQRVVRVPGNWPRIVEVARQLRETLPGRPDVRALAEFLRRRKAADPVTFPDLSLTVVKLLGPGEYVVLEPQEPSVGHFGLAVMDYTHGTAPNRRYADIIIQRLLMAALDKQPCPYSLDELAAYAVTCTDRDQAAKKVERFMRKAFAAVLLRDRVGELFDGIVTGASVKGTYVRIKTPPAEGRVISGEKGMVVGQNVRVRLKGMNPYLGQIDFEKG